MERTQRPRLFEMRQVVAYLPKPETLDAAYAVPAHDLAGGLCVDRSCDIPLGTVVYRRAAIAPGGDMLHRIIA